MSVGIFCDCEKKDRSQWRVRVYRANYSAFNGYRKTSSDYSEVYCTVCRRAWRTKAKYVEELKSL